MSSKLKGIKTIANKVKQTKKHQQIDMKTESNKRIEFPSKKQAGMPPTGIRSKMADLDTAYIPTAPEVEGEVQVESSDLSVTSRFESCEAMTPVSATDSSASPRNFSKDNDSVKVFVRIRPPSAKEMKEGNPISVQKTSDASLQLRTHEGYRNFAFDGVVGDNVNQETLFQSYAAPIVERCLSGYSGCIFAYGQTGSGKTYTMLGDASLHEQQLSTSAGIIPRVFKYLFELLEERQLAMSGNVDFECKCSFLEIYNETITDLLDPKKTNLQVREDKTGAYAAGLTEASVRSMDEAVRLVNAGTANRKVAHTRMNAESSRSHSILSCIITTKRRNDSGVVSVFKSRLNLVDLAGSERQSATGARGARLKEASSINKSLSTLGLVILSLGDAKGKKPRHVPYRDSKLTFLLQDSLGGKASAVMISNISPSTNNINETLSTLRFARGAKRVKNKVVANHACEGDVSALKAEITLLKQELKALKEQQSTFQTEEADETDPLLEESDKYSKAMEEVQSVGLEKPSTPSLQRIDSAKRAITALSEEITHLQSALETKESEITKYQKMGKLKDDKIQELEDTIREQNREAWVDDAEIQRLKNEVKFFKEKASKAPDAKKYALENIQLKQELSILRGNLEYLNKERFDEEIRELREKLLEMNEEIKRYREVEESKRKTEEVAKQVAVQPTSRIHPFMGNSRMRHEGNRFVSRYFAHLARWARTVVGVITKPLTKLRFRMKKKRE